MNAATPMMIDEEPATDVVVPFGQEPRLPTVPALPKEEEVRAALLRTEIPATATAAAKPKRAATEREIETAVWLLNLARQMSLTTFAAVGQLVKIDSTALSRYLRGTYEADISKLTARIEQFRADWTSQQQLGEMPFIAELSVVQEITTFCEMARLTRQMAPLWGDSQSGKTWALKQVQRDPAKDTIYWRIKAGGSVNESIDDLCQECGISTRKSAAEKRARIHKRIQAHTLLIVDELHQLFPPISRSLKMGLLERIREIHDECGCGVVLCGTQVFADMLENPKFKDFLAQTGRRGVLRKFIPIAPLEADLELMYRAYRLPMPTGKVAKMAAEIANTNGIGVLAQHFQIARMLAMNASTPLTWEHFKITRNSLVTNAGRGRNL